MSNNMQGCVDCSQFVFSLDIELVDELAQPVSVVDYEIILESKNVVLKKGMSDGVGRIVVDGLPPLPLRLVLNTDKLINTMQKPERHLRLGRALQDSTVKPRAEQQGREYSYVTVGQLINKLPVLPDWPEKRALPHFHFPDKAPQGWPIRPRGNVHARMPNKQGIVVMMKKRYLLLGIVGFVVFYISRPWLPMLYWGDSIEVEINLPAHLVPSVGGEYSSTSCQSLTTSDFSWINGRRSGDARLEKISDTQYRAKVYFKDFGPCDWRLTAIGWNLEYKDPGSVLIGATGASGGGNTIVIGPDAYFNDSERNSPFYSDAKVMEINRSLVPYVLPDPGKETKGFFIGSDNESGFDPHYYYNPYKHSGEAKIIYNVTVDESSLKGLTVDEAYRLQEERLARERKEKQEKEVAEDRRVQAIIDENRRQRELREARELNQVEVNATLKSSKE